MPLEAQDIRVNLDVTTPEYLENGEMRRIIRQTGITLQAMREALGELRYNFPTQLLPAYNDELYAHAVDPVDPPHPPPAARRLRGASGLLTDTLLTDVEKRNRESMEPLRTSNGLQELLYNNMYDNAVCKFLSRTSYLANTERVNYVAIDGDKLSYMPKGRMQETWPDGTWKDDGRQSGKPGRIARMLIPRERLSTFSDSDFEKFANLVKSTNALTRATFETVKGDDIRRLYDESMYVTEQNSSLTQSCMRYSKCRRYFGVYTQNPDIISMLVLQDNDTAKIHGRALLWNIPGFNTTIMDRIYGPDSVQAAFREYAKSKGWIYRAYNSFEYETTFIHNNEVIYLDICVKLPNYQFDYYPYLDTMKFFDRKNGTFSNRVRSKRYDRNEYVTALISTRGEGAYLYWSDLPEADADITSFVKSMGKPQESYADDFAPEDPDYMDEDEDDFYLTVDDDDDDDENWPVPEDV